MRERLTVYHMYEKILTFFRYVLKDRSSEDEIDLASLSPSTDESREDLKPYRDDLQVEYQIGPVGYIYHGHNESPDSSELDVRHHLCLTHIIVNVLIHLSFTILDGRGILKMDEHCWTGSSQAF